VTLAADGALGHRNLREDSGIGGGGGPESDSSPTVSQRLLMLEWLLHQSQPGEAEYTLIGYTMHTTCPLQVIRAPCVTTV
jgi:hypothetical protein